jgi:PAS domain S-box-containing protein
MTTLDTANAPVADDVTQLQQRIADLEQQIAAHAATDEQLNRVEAELHIFRSMVESAIDGISFATPDRIVRYANRAFGQMSGYGERCTGHMMSDFISSEDRAVVQQDVGSAIRDTGRWQGRIPYLRPNRVVWQAQASVFRVDGPDGSSIGQAIILRDAAEQIRNEQERALLHEQVIAAQQAALGELRRQLFLGLDLSGITTRATLQSGIAFALAGRAIDADRKGRDNAS